HRVFKVAIMIEDRRCDRQYALRKITVVDRPAILLCEAHLPPISLERDRSRPAQLLKHLLCLGPVKPGVCSRKPPGSPHQHWQTLAHPHVDAQIASAVFGGDKHYAILHNPPPQRCRDTESL